MIGPAQTADEPAILGLLASSSLPTSDLTPAALRQFLVLREDDRVVGAIGLEIEGDVALLRSLAVDPKRRERGAGTRLAIAAEQQAVNRGVKRIFLLTTTAAPFFASRGYRAIARSEAPPGIRRTAEFSELCPASSTFMVKDL